MEYLTTPILETWKVISQMAPFLLLGFVFSGLLKYLVKPDFIKRHLGSGKWSDSLKATVIGIPLPLCSCGVLPLSATLRKEGASPQATLSFLTSTPQTGVDSILATWGLMGPVFAVARVIVAFITGIISGIVAGPFAIKLPSDTPAEAPAQKSCCSSQKTEKVSAREAFLFAAYTLPKGIGKALIFGLIIAGLVSAYLPIDTFSGSIGQGFSAYILVSCFSIPLYICSTGSIPVAFALLQAGMSPGAALVFLVTGPSTHAATVTIMGKLMGKKAMGIYLVVLALSTWICAWFFDRLLAGQSSLFSMEHLHALEPGLFGQICGAILLLMLTVALWPQKAVASCCGGNHATEEALNAEDHSCCCGHHHKPKPMEEAPKSCCCHEKSHSQK